MTVTTASEQPIYQDDDGVFVSQTRVVIQGTTFAMANVTSVRAVQQPPNHALSVVIGFIGLLSMLYRWYVGAIIIAVAIWFGYLNKGQWTIVIGSSSGEVRALTSPRKDYIVNLVGAINSAIVARG